MDEKFRVLLTGGGSGGHIYPLLAVADALIEKGAELGFNEELIYLGPKDSYDPLFTARNIEINHLTTGKLRRYFSIENFLDIPKVFISFIQAFWKVYTLMPDIIFSKGGTGALPVVLAGWFYRIPVAIHDSDAIPGMTNSVSAKFATKIFLAFAAAADKFTDKKIIKKISVVGNPVREDLLRGRVEMKAAKESLGFSSSHPLLLILGGSQGSTRINNFIATNLPAIVAETQVLHQTGVANFLEAQKLSHAALIDEAPGGNRYVAVNYFTDNYATALSAADVVLARPGSNIFEIAAFGKPAILIPIAESANGHQLANAYAFADSGAGIVIEEPNLLPGVFLNELKKILSNEDVWEKMSAASEKFFTPGAAGAIAEGLLKMTL
jgi:UDP-N-acetylglucosamine--N-acetylmuramyl-(pentapeptide) pyrophosphoryl-undecaprenol N-acetylglucosamine transferase